MADDADSRLGRVPARSMLSDGVYDVLRGALLARRLTPGAHLNLDELARELHVSKTPVRQALARLVSDGLVNQVPYRGFFASLLLDKEQIAHLYEYRLVLEPAAAEFAAARRTDEAAATLLGIADADEVAAILARNELTALGGRDTSFHVHVAATTGNPLFESQIGQIIARGTQYAPFTSVEWAREAWLEHLEVARAIERADPSAAREAMRRHLRNAMRRMHDAVDAR
jgi:DNA-binding GntR family transcriptional regulator